MLPEPAVAVIVPEPHEPVRPLGVETTIPVGSESVTATPVRADPPFGLVMVKLKLVVPFVPMLDAPNAFVMVGGEVGLAPTVSVADATVPVPPSLELIMPVVLTLVPVVVVVTFTARLQDP